MISDPGENVGKPGLRLSDVRGFARHVANFDPRTEVPPVGMLPGWKRAKPPYVHSDAEIVTCHRSFIQQQLESH